VGQFRFNNVPDWMSTDGSTPASESVGITQTKAVYVQDAWSFFPNWKLIVGGREEWWLKPAAMFVDVRERLLGKCWAPRAIRRLNYL
jgi:outer membrane receptor protein involved in Fe transport